MKFRSQYITDASGSVGGVTVQKNHYGLIMKARKKPVNPKSTFQMAIRAILSNLTKSFSSLTANQVDQWNTLAKSINYSDKLGMPITLTAISMFVKLNANLVYCGEASNANPPALSLNNVAAKDITVSIVTTPGAEDILLDLSSAIAADEKLIIESTGVIAEGIRYFKNWKAFGVLDSTFVSGSSIKALYEARFGAMPSTGDKAAFRCKVIKVGAGFESAATVTEAYGTV